MLEIASQASDFKNVPGVNAPGPPYSTLYTTNTSIFLFRATLACMHILILFNCNIN